MPGNDSSACTSGLVAHAVPRRLRASFARIHSQPVQRTLHAQRTTLQHVEIRHRRPHVSVAEQFLHCTNVIPSFEQVRRETVAEPILTLPMNRRPPSFTTDTIRSTANT